jgi:hypothetical protein
VAIRIIFLFAEAGLTVGAIVTILITARDSDCGYRQELCLEVSNTVYGMLITVAALAVHLGNAIGFTLTVRSYQKLSQRGQDSEHDRTI